MSNKEELGEMGIEVRECKECCRDISEEEYRKYEGYCKNCYEERRDIERRKIEYNNEEQEDDEEEFEENGKNVVATIVKVIALISAIAGIILGVYLIEEMEIMAVTIIISSIISSVFVYALGEIIQKLENIERNTKG